MRIINLFSLCYNKVRDLYRRGIGNIFVIISKLWYNTLMEKQTITAKDVAAYFVKLDDIRDAEDGVTNLKLQKLVYYAQGYHLAYFDKPLFSDSIEAWQYGPVVPNLYKDLARFGRSPVVFSDERNFSEIFSDNVRNLLDSIFEQLGQYSAWKLMEMTHDEEPWKTTDMHMEIGKDKLRSYFKKRIS